MTLQSYTKHCLLIYFLLMTHGSAQQVDNQPKREAYIQEIEEKLIQLTVQNANLKLENVDLWGKIEGLEAKIGDQKKVLLENDEKDREKRERMKKCEEEVKVHKGELKQTQDEIAKRLVTTQGHRRVTIAANKELKECQQQLNATTCVEGTAAEMNTKKQELEDKIYKCEDSQRSNRNQYEKDSKELEEIQKQQGKIRKKDEECSGKLKTCTSATDQLDFMKMGYDLVMKELKDKEKQLLKDNDDCLQMAKEVIEGATGYRLLVTLGGVVMFIWASVEGWRWVRDKTNDRIKQMAQDKQRDKMAARKKHKR